MNNKREESQLRDGDNKLSSLISDILEQEFYKPYTTGFRRICANDIQTQGIDVVFLLDGKTYLCDEKAAVRYNNLSTFALEITFLNHANRIQDGWLLSKRDVNNSFLFIWRDFNRLEIALVEKEKLLQYLEGLGWSDELLRLKSKRIRDNEKEPLGNFKDNGCRFTFSSHLVEKPINILLPRHVYRTLAVYTKIFYIDGLAKKIESAVMSMNSMAR